MIVNIATRRLPFDSDQLYTNLTDYFPGRMVSIVEQGEFTKVSLSYPTTKEYYIDPLLLKGLEWWGDGVNVNDIPTCKKNFGKFQLSLNDNWTLHAWSKWLDSKQYKRQEFKEVVILHVDDHLDCLPPLLFNKGNNNFVDPLSGTEVSLKDQKAVETAILSGSISIGSFMPLFLHYFDRVHFRHLMPLHRLERSYKKGKVGKTFIKDSLLGPGSDRPSLEFDWRESSGITYHPTVDINEFIDDIPVGVPVLVHVDMDYFNNRFDGDSDWQHHSFIHDQSSESVHKSIALVISALKKVQNVEDFTVALSPGFFPVEFWEESVEIIKSILD